MFLVKKNSTIVKKPTEASPDTKEQLDSQNVLGENQGVNKKSPSKKIISLGLDRPHKSFKKKFTTTRILIIEDIHIKTMSLK